MSRLLTDSLFITLVVLNAGAMYLSSGIPALRLAVPPLLGALIGYITNVLAVWMIFNPKRPFLGYQGVVPRKKGEIARRLADVIERELINPESILSLLKSRRREIERGIAHAVVRVMRNERRNLRELLGNNYEVFRSFALNLYRTYSPFLAGLLEDTLKSEDTLRWVEERVLRRAYSSAEGRSLSSIFPGVEEALWGVLLRAIEKLRDPEVVGKVAEVIDGALRRSQRGKPEGFVLSVLNAITGGYSRGKIEEILRSLPETVETDEEVRSGLRAVLRSVLNKPIGEVVPHATFVSGTKAVLRFVVSEFLDRKALERLATSPKVVEVVEEVLEAVLSLSPADVVRSVGEDRFGRAVEELLDGSFPFVLPFVKEVVGKVDVRRIVVERIEGYSVEELEDLVFGMMSKEFRFIEYMGIPIGALVGAVQLMVGGM